MTVDGEGDLVISRIRDGRIVSIVRDPEGADPYPLTVTKFNFLVPKGINRIARLFFLIKFIWPYTK